jgi:hypothetical protein
MKLVMTSVFGNKQLTILRGLLNVTTNIAASIFRIIAFGRGISEASQLALESIDDQVIIR